MPMICCRRVASADAHAIGGCLQAALWWQAETLVTCGMWLWLQSIAWVTIFRCNDCDRRDYTCALESSAHVHAGLS